MSAGKVVARPLAAFAGKFVAVFLLLALPWPFLTNLYVDLGQEVGVMIFNSTNARRTMSFAFLKDPERPFDARITIVNPVLLNPDGSGPVRHFDFDTKAVFWNPCALLLALVIASPVPWKRRLRSLAISLPLLWISMLVFLHFCLWRESAEIGLLALSPFWQEATSILCLVFTSSIGLGAPVLLWLVVTFRQEDLTRLKKTFR